MKNTNIYYGNNCFLHTLQVTSLGVTTFSLCALGIDRFHAATSTMPKARRIERCQKVLAKLAVVWIGSMVLASPELLLWQLHQVTPSGLSDQVDTCIMSPYPDLPESIYSLIINYHDARMWWYFGFYFCLPVVFTLLCQLATCHVSGGSGSSTKRPEERSPSKKLKLQHAQQIERQLNCTVMALAVVYGVCTLPENVCSLTLAYTPIQVSEEMTSLLALINQFFLFFKSSVTPVLLLCLCKSLGQAFMDCCCCCCEECQPSNSSSTQNVAEGKLKTTNDGSSIFFDKAKDSSTILSIGSWAGGSHPQVMTSWHGTYNLPSSHCPQAIITLAFLTVMLEQVSIVQQIWVQIAILVLVQILWKKNKHF